MLECIEIAPICKHISMLIHDTMSKGVSYHCALHYMTHKVKSEPINLKKKISNMISQKQFMELQ